MRLILGFGILALLFACLVSTIVWFATSAEVGPASWQQNGSGRPRFFLFGPVIVVIIVVSTTLFVGRRIRRTVEPLVDLIEAADRVAEGTYDVRVPVSGPTEVQRLIHAFNGMAERLDVQEDLRRRFFADIAHELRTPLAIVQGTVEGMLDGVYPQDEAHLRPVLDETAMIARLLDDLQLLATSEAGMLRMHRSSVDVAALLGDVVTAFRSRADALGVTMAASGAVGEIEVDPIRLRQVLDNLVSNALRYTPSGGEIRLRADRDPAGVTITVRDTGRGMPSDDVAHIFERFVKAADSGGSGLGLAIAKAIVEAHGGTIVAESAPGAGMTVTIALPDVSTIG